MRRAMNVKLYKCVLACLLTLYSASILNCSKANEEKLNRYLDVVIGEWVQAAPYGEIIHNYLTKDGRLYGVVATQPGEHPYSFIAAIVGENQSATEGNEEHLVLGDLIYEVQLLNSRYLGINLSSTDSLFVPDINDDGRIDLLVHGYRYAIPAQYRWDKKTGVTPMNMLESNRP